MPDGFSSILLDKDLLLSLHQIPGFGPKGIQYGKFPVFPPYFLNVVLEILSNSGAVEGNFITFEIVILLRNNY